MPTLHSLLAVSLAFVFTAIAGCSRQYQEHNQAQFGSSEQKRIVSVDFCADQFLLKLADHEDIVALSPDSEKSFSYLRELAGNFQKVRPRAEDILLLSPDMVVRSYGGGPNATAYFERTGIEVIQINYASDLEGVKQNILNVAEALGESNRGEELVREMDERLHAIKEPKKSVRALYLTSKGAVAGRNTLIDELFTHAGIENFQSANGWGELPLEALVDQRPDMIAAGFFDTTDLVSDVWTPTRHPVAQRRLRNTPVTELPGAWTACGGWFLIDAIETLAASAAQTVETP